MGDKLPERINDFREKFKNISYELEKLVKTIAHYYKTEETLMINGKLRGLIVNHLKNCEKANTCAVNSCDTEYETLSCEVSLGSRPIKSIVDTDASLSVISEDLAKKAE